MAGDKFGASEMVIPSTPSKPSFGTRVKNHFRRWWWAHVIAFIAIVLVVVLPVVYVGYPNIAQSDVDDSTITIEKIVITDPKPESLHMNQTEVLGTDSAFHPKFFSFNASVSLAGSEDSFVTLTIPEIKAVDGTIINVDQDVKLHDVDAFGDFSKAVMMNEEVEMILYGRPELKQGALPTITVTYNKTVNIKGLNKLKGFNVTDYTITLKPDIHGNNMNGTVFIPNPSVLTITMGNVTLDLSVDGTKVGQAFLNDFVLKPGDNTFNMTSKVDQDKVMDMIGDKYNDGIVPFDITGKSAVYDGKELPYFTKALGANTMSIRLNVLEGLKT